jgi:lysophospholipase L1-like esterase
MRMLSASLLCVLLAAPLVLAQTSAPATALARPQDPTVPAIKYDKDGITANARFLKMHEQFLERAKQGNVDLLFLGDSITQGWGGNGKEVWAKHYASRNAANFGIGGDRTQHVLWRIENGELEGIKPKAIVLLIGTNNTATDDADRIAEGVTKIVKSAQAKTGAKILLLGVFPRGETIEKGGRQRERITRINEVISKLDDGQTIRYLDLTDKFLQPDGTISKDIMHDYLHLTPRGYEIWAAAMEPLLAEMLGEQPSPAETSTAPAH